MASPTSSNAAVAERARQRKLWIQILSLIAITVFLCFRPQIEAWLGDDQSASAPVSHSDAVDPPASEQVTGSERRAQDSAAGGPEKDDLPPAEVPAGGPLQSDELDATPAETEAPSNRSRTTPAVVRAEQTDAKSPERKRSTDTKSSSPAANKSTTDLGTLHEVRTDVFESTAGLLYVPGSEDGHRLKHIMKHTKDDPSKQMHGVFESADRNSVLALIDEAFLKTKEGGSDVRVQKQGGNRTVYTINLRRRIGSTGGIVGERTGNPECRYLRLVLEPGNKVITAYPTKSF